MCKMGSYSLTNEKVSGALKTQNHMAFGHEKAGTFLVILELLNTNELMQVLPKCANPICANPTTFSRIEFPKMCI